MEYQENTINQSFNLTFSSETSYISEGAISENANQENIGNEDNFKNNSQMNDQINNKNLYIQLMIQDLFKDPNLNQLSFSFNNPLN